MVMTIVEARPITGGVDTHLEFHVAAALDQVGTLLGTKSFSADASGYKDLLSWLGTFGQVSKVGVEGTGSYGAGLARYLSRHGIVVIEVNRPDRGEQYRAGKSDPLDAVEAARAALGGRAKAISKTKDGHVEAIRVLVVAKRSARQARTKAIIQMRHLGITAPDEIQQRLKGLTVKSLVSESARLRPKASREVVTAATKASLSSLAHRVIALDDELAELDEQINAQVKVVAPELLARFWGRSRDCCRAVGRCRRQLGAASIRGRMGTPLWCGSYPCPIGEERRSLPSRRRR
jgi:transposase